MFEMTSNIKIVHSYFFVTQEIKMINYKPLRFEIKMILSIYNQSLFCILIYFFKILGYFRTQNCSFWIIYFLVFEKVIVKSKYWRKRGEIFSKKRATYTNNCIWCRSLFCHFMINFCIAILTCQIRSYIRIRSQRV